MKEIKKEFVQQILEEIEKLGNQYKQDLDCPETVKETLMRLSARKTHLIGIYYNTDLTLCLLFELLNLTEELKKKPNLDPLKAAIQSLTNKILLAHETKVQLDRKFSNSEVIKF